MHSMQANECQMASCLSPCHFDDFGFYAYGFLANEKSHMSFGSHAFCKATKWTLLGIASAVLKFTPKQPRRVSTCCILPF